MLEYSKNVKIGFLKSLYVGKNLYYLLGGLFVFFMVTFFIPALLILGYVGSILLIGIVLLDFVLLYLTKGSIYSNRQVQVKLSNGDFNLTQVYIKNDFRFQINLKIIDEYPVEFESNIPLNYISLNNLNEDFTSIKYLLRPIKRGEYYFWNTNIYVSSILGIISRRFITGSFEKVYSYPSIIQMKKFEYLAINNRLIDSGVKKIRKVGNSSEFEMIKEYNSGDDYRKINWKATAKRGVLHVNNYQQERSQSIYCIIDQSRLMKMPFNNLSLMDYSINSGLVLTNTALLTHDKAGVITLDTDEVKILPASRKPGQINKILEFLYKVSTKYLESDYEAMATIVRNKISQRSLMILFTNFESLESLEKCLPSMRSISRKHKLVVVLFENTDLLEIHLNSSIEKIEVYTKVASEMLMMEKKMIVNRLKQSGIQTLFTPPHKLTPNSVNLYLEIKARGVI